MLCLAAAHAGMLPCSQADVLMRRVINPDNGAAVLPRRPATASVLPRCCAALLLCMLPGESRNVTQYSTRENVKT